MVRLQIRACIHVSVCMRVLRVIYYNWVGRTECVGGFCVSMHAHADDHIIYTMYTYKCNANMSCDWRPSALIAHNAPEQIGHERSTERKC